MKLVAGRRAKFRTNVWFGDVRLRDVLVSMFHLAVERGRGGYLGKDGETVWWGIVLCREVQDLELEKVLALLENLYEMRNSGGGRNF